uniref:Uncharacterized protein LOC114325658 n=1 Tax=Diabrotica virgifera virgifera TaxID=50390 RepID=A0A6P7F7Z4_DIAVI
MAKTTSAERMKKHRQKLKEDKEKYEAHKEKEKTRDKKRRDSLKTRMLHSTKVCKDYKEKERLRKRLYRKKKRMTEMSNKLAETSPCVSELGSFKRPQSLGKAVKRVKNVLPFSPSKKSAVLCKLINESFPKVAKNLFNDKSVLSKSSTPEETIVLVKDFYATDSISRQTPGIKDFKSIKDPESGKRSKVQLQHMNMTVKEAFALFKEDNPTVKISSLKI